MKKPLKNSNRGGARPGAGYPKGTNRKPEDELKVQMPIYVPAKAFNLLGRAGCRDIAIAAIMDAYEQKIRP